jgi:glyoxylase-like metal-dependent hydrolase (beta-lactamase superfamily II)
MALEDHVGDILRKARLMARVEAPAAAAAAGLTEAELSKLEESGTITRRPNFSALGRLLALDATKLERVAGGWEPRPTDLSRWRGLRQFSTTQNGNTVHCYLVWDDLTREAALFDTGWDASDPLRLADTEGLQLKHLFITHGHHDHIAGLDCVRTRWPKLRLHTDMKGAPPPDRNGRNDCIQLGSLRITNRDTPGHAEDGVTYVVENWPDGAPPVAMVGDAIFAGSMGGAREHGALAKQKVREQILSLPPETLLCPGHGPLTSVGEERAVNPFF